MHLRSEADYRGVGVVLHQPPHIVHLILDQRHPAGALLFAKPGPSKIQYDNFPLPLLIGPSRANAAVSAAHVGEVDVPMVDAHLVQRGEDIGKASSNSRQPLSLPIRSGSGEDAPVGRGQRLHRMTSLHHQRIRFSQGPRLPSPGPEPQRGDGPAQPAPLQEIVCPRLPLDPVQDIGAGPLRGGAGVKLGRAVLDRQRYMFRGG